MRNWQRWAFAFVLAFAGAALANVLDPAVTSVMGILKGGLIATLPVVAALKMTLGQPGTNWWRWAACFALATVTGVVQTLTEPGSHLPIEYVRHAVVGMLPLIASLKLTINPDEAAAVGGAGTAGPPPAGPWGGGGK